MRHIINAVVENQPGVLARVVGLISGRGYNIEALNVGPCADPMISRMNITVTGDEHVLEQIIKQLNKLVDVIKVNDLTGQCHIERELVLVEIGAPKNKRGEIIELSYLFKARIISTKENSMTVQFVGTQDEIDDFLRLLRTYTIINLSRSGAIAVTRGGE